jgi:hypothetical protein
MSGNAWPELIAIGTVMRPMVSGMDFACLRAVWIRGRAGRLVCDR